MRPGSDDQSNLGPSAPHEDKFRHDCMYWPSFEERTGKLMMSENRLVSPVSLSPRNTIRRCYSTHLIAIIRNDEDSWCSHTGNFSQKSHGQMIHASRTKLSVIRSISSNAEDPLNVLHW